MLDSLMEEDLMGWYFEAVGKLRSVHSSSLPRGSDAVPNITIFTVSFNKDKLFKNPPVMLGY